MIYKNAISPNCFMKLMVIVLALALAIGVTAYAQSNDSGYVACVANDRYATVAEAVAAADGQTVKLLNNSNETVTVSEDLYLDLNGYTLAGLIMMDGTLYGMDSTTDDYDCTDGYGMIRYFEGTYEIPNIYEENEQTKRYLTVEENGVLSFHRFYLGITHNSLCPSRNGVGYQALFAGDQMVRDQLHPTEALGYALQLEDFKPVDRWLSADQVVSGKRVSLRVNNYDEAGYGQAQLFANVQMQLSDGTQITSHTHVSTLRQMVESVNAQVSNYTHTQLNTLAAWIRASETMLGWQVENILNPLSVIKVRDVKAQPGETVQVPVQISGNPGVAGAKITLSYDSTLTLVGAVSGEAFSDLQYTGPGRYVSPCSFTWDSESGEVTENGTILVLTFQVPADAAGKTYELGCTYRLGDIYDEDLNDVQVQVLGGSITVEVAQGAQQYTVTFCDYDGTVLKTQTVEHGGKATAPAQPSRPGYLFTGWDRQFNQVTSNVVVTAQYQKIDGAAIAVSSVTAEPGQSVEVPVQIMNNPGLAGAKFTLSFDSALTLTGAVSGEAFSDLQYTKPGKFVSPCNFTWDSESGEVAENGTVLVLTFQVPVDAAGKTYDLICTYRYGDMYDEDLNDVAFTMISGSISVEAKETVKNYTVTFRDHDGTVLKTETVTSGIAATAPQSPARDGYLFIGWDKSFDAITSDLVVTAQYEKVTKPTILVSQVTAKAGETVQVPVQIISNPGLAGAKITMSYDSTLILTGAVSGEAFANLQYTKPGKFVSPCNFTWDSESGEVTENGTILILAFQVPADAAGKTFDLICSYRFGDMYDEDLDDVEFAIISGSISVQ